MPDIQIGGSRYTLRNFPDKCPFCHQKTVPLMISGHKRSGTEIEVYFVCPDASCNRSFIGYMSHVTGSSSSFFWNGLTTIGVLASKKFSSTISDISPSFVDIFNQAYQAEQYNLLEICGVGYRKALEFLIKDYAIKLHPDKSDTIKSKMLAPCIKDYVNDERVKKVAHRAVWIGNDETHYVRKWQGKDLNDLKSLINLTVHWIEMDELTNNMINDMPE
ncbi:MAG: DUF4145 domain-containing protein [Flavobacterium sp.]|nr:MAG: DUF4145 domain-containing protein [Flavobacterium sp.]